MASVPSYVVTARPVTVNTKNTGATIIIDPCARRWVTLAIGVRVVASSGITIAANLTIGSEASTYQNVFGDSGARIVPAAGFVDKIVWQDLSTETEYISYADLTTSGLRVNVTVAATGTSQSVEIIVVGYYV